MKFAKYFIITTFVTLYLVTSSISTIHSIDFFKLSNPDWLAIALAVAFEIGAAASLASIITLDKMNKLIVWGLFIILTLMQVMSNLFYAYTHLNDYHSWVELFGLVDYDVITQKRYVAIISGAILPLVALGFIKSLVDYMQPTVDVIELDEEDSEEDFIYQPEPVPAIAVPVIEPEVIPEPIAIPVVIDPIVNEVEAPPVIVAEADPEPEQQVVEDVQPEPEVTPEEEPVINESPQVSEGEIIVPVIDKIKVFKS